MELRNNWRKSQDRLVTFLITALGLLVLSPLLIIFAYLVANGLESFSWAFFTELPRPVGEKGGGMLHAIVGTLYMVLISGVLAIPLGLLVGIFLAEGASSYLKNGVRVAIDLLNGTPSIVVGIFVYTLLVKPFKTFNALAGAVALSLVMLPVVVKSVEEILRLVPKDVRHGALSLGLSRWKVVLFVVVWGKRKNLLPGILLGLSRSMGETAPLLFTAFGSLYLSFSPVGPMASLPVEIYNYAISPYEHWHQLAWTGCLTLIAIVFFLNLVSKAMLNSTNFSTLAKRKSL